MLALGSMAPLHRSKSDKHTRYWRRLPIVGLGTGKADGNREDRDIMLLRRVVSIAIIIYFRESRNDLVARRTPPKTMVARD